MNRTILFALVLACMPGPAIAVQPNMQPGQWEYTTATRVAGPVDIPEQTSTHTQCVTEGEINDADAFMEDVEDCEVKRREVTADKAGFTLVCPGQQGTEMRMTMDMRLLGNRVEGESVVTLLMSGESMKMRSRVEGRRVGDC